MSMKPMTEISEFPANRDMWGWHRKQIDRFFYIRVYTRHFYAAGKDVSSKVLSSRVAALDSSNWIYAGDDRQRYLSSKQPSIVTALLALIAVISGLAACVHGFCILDYGSGAILSGVLWLLGRWGVMTFGGYWVVTFFVG
jgi:hypothetical protein